MQKNINKIGIALRPDTPNIINLFIQIKRALESEGIEVFLEETPNTKELDALPLKSLVDKVDAMASIGGDGTLISLMRRLYHYSLPIFGINIGNLGFLTAINPQEVAIFAKNLKNGDYKLNTHMLLQAQIGNRMQIAINEFLISKDNLFSGIPKVHAFIENEHFNTYRADSLIIATPIGSTAYNISAGGSIVYPLCENILITPVAAHTLTQRPMVLHATCTLKLKTTTCGFLIIDGQEKLAITPEDDIFIKAAKNHGYLIQKQDRSYFQILREKFQWGQQ